MPVRKPFGQNTLLGLSRLELLTLRLSGVHSNQLSYRPFVLGKGRTLNLRIRSSALYPLSYEHINMKLFPHTSRMSTSNTTHACVGKISIHTPPNVNNKNEKNNIYTKGPSLNSTNKSLLRRSRSKRSAISKSPFGEERLRRRGLLHPKPFEARNASTSSNQSFSKNHAHIPYIHLQNDKLGTSLNHLHGCVASEAQTLFLIEDHLQEGCYTHRL